MARLCPTEEMRTIVANTPVVFEDVRAKKISVKVVAVSRFSSLFETPSDTSRTSTAEAEKNLRVFLISTLSRWQI